MVWTRIARRAGLSVPLSGFCAPGFEPVGEAFGEQLARGEEGGGAVAVTHRGEVVVDLWGGWADRGTALRRPRRWEEDTVAVIFSATKGLVALVLLQLHEAGAFDYDEPVARSWPGFAAAGKAGISIRTLLNHRAGLAAIDVPLAMEDVTRPERWPRVVEALEAQRPLWAPGSAQGYHATSYGLLASELIRRVAPGIDLPAHFRARIAEPLGAEVWLGAPEAVDPRVATLYPPGVGTRVQEMLPAVVSRRGADGHVGRAFITRGSLGRRAFTNPLVPRGDVRIYDSVPVRRAGLAWAGAVANARGLARIYGALANGGEAFGARLVEEASLRPVFDRQSWSDADLVLGKPLGWSQGFLKEETQLFSPHTESFGHAGLGGSLGWADPITGTSFGYVTNTLDWRVRSRRSIELCRALYASPAMQRRGS